MYGSNSNCTAAMLHARPQFQLYGNSPKCTASMFKLRQCYVKWMRFLLRHPSRRSARSSPEHKHTNAVFEQGNPLDACCVRTALGSTVHTCKDADKGL